MSATNSTAKERLLLLIKELGYGQTKFETLVGLSNGYISKLKASPSSEMIRRIVGKFPQVNPEWLLTGKGEMLRASVTQNGNHNNIQLGNGNIYICIDSGFKALMQLVEANQKNCEQFNEIVKKSQEQIDRLIALLEKKYNE